MAENNNNANEKDINCAVAILIGLTESSSGSNDTALDISNGNSEDDITLRVATADDQDGILNFIRTYYYPEEPLTLGNDPKVQSDEDEKFSLSVLPYGASVIAVDRKRDSQIVGVLLAAPIGPQEADEMVEEAKNCKDKKWSEILGFLAHLERSANIYERYNVSRALHVHVMGVDPRTRGKAIGTKLMKKCMEIAKSRGFLLLTADCTSIYSIQIAKNLQMECIVDLAYEDYRDVNGKQLFRPPLPHTRVNTFAKRLWMRTARHSSLFVLLGHFVNWHISKYNAYNAYI